MFGPREMLLSSQEPVVRQFLNARGSGPIGMSEEKDADGAGVRSATTDACRRCRRSRCQLEPSDGVGPADPAAGRATGAGANGIDRRRRGRSAAHPARRPTGSGGGLVSNPAAATLRSTGSLFALFLDMVRALPRRPFQSREFIDQAWFIASVTILPTALVSIPFGAVIALQLGNLTRQIGAQSLHRRGERAGDRARGQPDRDGAADRRRRRLGDLRRPRLAQDPRGDRRHGGARHLARSSGWSCRACSPRMLVSVLLNGLVSVVGVGRRLLLQRHPAGRYAGRLPRVVHRASRSCRTCTSVRSRR